MGKDRYVRSVLGYVYNNYVISGIDYGKLGQDEKNYSMSENLRSVLSESRQIMFNTHLH